MRPQHERGALVAALERGAFVAGGFLEVLLIGLHRIDGIGRANFFVFEGHDAQRRRAAIRAAPMRQRQRAIEDFADLELLAVVMVLIAPGAPGASGAPVAHMFGRAAFLDAQQGHMQLASRITRGCCQRACGGRVGTLERGKRQLGWRVGMCERVDQLQGPGSVGGLLAVRPVAQQCGERSRLALVGRRPGQLALALVMTQQVVDQRHAAARGHRQHFMQAVGIEGRKGDFREVVAAQLEPHFALAVAHQQLAAGVQRGQRDDQRGKHARRLLGVAVAHEKTTLVVDQHLVQLGHHALASAQPSGRTPGDGLQHRRPVFAADVHALGADLPGAAHGNVNQRLTAQAIGRAFGGGDELRGLYRQQRQGDRPDTVDLDQRQVHRAAARGAEVARCLHGAQDVGE